jgi:hypothetical protein
MEASDGDLMTKSRPKIVVVRPPPPPPPLDDGLLESRVERSNLGTPTTLLLGLVFDLDPSMSSIVLAFGGSPLAIADADVCCDTDSGTLDLSYHDRIVELDIFRWPRLDASDTSLLSFPSALDPFLLDEGRMFAIAALICVGNVSDSSSHL